MRVNNKTQVETIILTGANNGIGFHMTKALLEQDYLVAGFDIESNKLTDLQKLYPERLMVLKTDVTKNEEVHKSVRRVIDNWEKVDILVNNACLAIFSPFDQKEIGDTQREFDINVFGYIRMISAVLPHMKERGNGIIHNVSSGVGITGFPGIHGYASSKGAIEALTLSLSFELEAYGISVTTMHPPLTNTKSAAPLGIPARMMEDPANVGEQLARKITVKKPVVTPNLKTTIYLFFARRFPRAIGKFMGKVAEKEWDKNE